MRLSDRQHTHPALCCSFSILPHHRTIMRCANATKNAEDCLLLQFLLPPTSPAAATTVAMTCRSGGAAIVAIAGFVDFDSDWASLNRIWGAN